MFWGCFSGLYGKGPGQLWEKEWGSITALSYQERIVPLVDGELRLHADREIVFMQDNAPAHRHRATIEDLAERGVIVINWPPYSPDLNPIESLWNMMKDWIEKHYPNDRYTYSEVRQQVLEAWAAVTQEDLDRLIATMPDRIEKLIEANGMFIPY
jgi:transposase